MEGKVVNSAFVIDFLSGAQLIEDDEMFYAAVVGFGAFGIIHGVLIEAEQEYVLEFQEITVEWGRFWNVFKSLQVAQAGFVGYEPEEVPFDATFVINPLGKMGVLRAMKKVAINDIPSEERISCDSAGRAVPLAVYNGLSKHVGQIGRMVGFLPSSLIPKPIRKWLYGLINDQGMRVRDIIGSFST